MKSNGIRHTIKDGNWQVIRNRLKLRYADLVDEDLKYIEGEEEELIDRIHQRTGRTREQVETAIRDLSRLGVTHRSSIPNADNLPVSGWGTP